MVVNAIQASPFILPSVRLLHAVHVDNLQNSFVTILHRDVLLNAL